jgi:hypothetical protein
MTFETQSHTPREEEEQVADTHAGPLALARLCIQLPERTPQLEAAEFLKKYREELGLPDEEGLLSRFRDRVWPEAVPTTLIASNISYGSRPEWLLRPVSEGPAAASYAAASQTLAMIAVAERGQLTVRRFEVAPHVAPRSHEVMVTAPLFWNSQNLYMEPEDLDELSAIPAHRAQTNDRLRSWREYLDWKEELIKQHQIKVPYLAWTWADENRLAFLVEQQALGNHALNHQELCVTPPEETESEDEEEKEPPSRSRRRASHPVEIGEVERVSKINPRDERARRLWGDDLRSHPPLSQITIALEKEEAERHRQRTEQFPMRGMLVSAIAGELAPLRYQRTAIQRLVNALGFCPRLADFLFEATRASVPAGPLPELPPIPGTRALNPGQSLAVQKALAAPDLCLIQGPPGTGKTTVIAELCLRVAHEGGRVLVASQTNLAVDNALSRLADLPQMRPLRMGKTDRVDEDFRDLLAENVVDRWFSTIGTSCTERAEANTLLEDELKREQSALADLREALRRHDEAQEALGSLGERLRTQVQQRALRTQQVSEKRGQEDQAQRRAEHFQALQDWARGSADLPALPPDFKVDSTPLARAAREKLAPADPVRDLEGLSLLATVKSRTAGLEELRRLLAECRRQCEGSALASAPPEFAGLLAERQRLSMSVEEADLVQLLALNKQIQKLQKDGWAQFTRELVETASRAFAGAQSTQVRQLVDALSPSSSLLPSIEALDQLIHQGLAAAEHVSHALPSLAREWDIRAGQERAWEQKAAQERIQLEAQIASLDREHAEVSSQRALHKEDLQSAQRLWAKAWSALYPAREPELAVSSPSSEGLREAAERQAGRYRELEPRLERHGRWRELQRKWLERLRKVTEADRSQVQELYKRHANVVGMTCNEAGKKEIYQSALFKPFDMVIIDEVSKATPAELLMPMLLGRKVVLVGDHRQLPPMFRERDYSFAEAKEEGAIPREKFEKYQRMVTSSLFQELFEAAPEPLKAMLWVQYRMHPQIMDAVNEFYGGKLQPGAASHVEDPRKALDTTRQHHLKIRDRADNSFLEPHQHLLWVDSSWERASQPHWEEQRGSSKLNHLEVKLVLESLRLLNGALRQRGYGPRVQFSVEPAEEGLTMRDFVRKRMRQPPEPTLDDLFAEKRVRIEGRSQKPQRPVRAGEKVVVDARRQVGVITFYGAQLRELRQAIMAEQDSLDAMEPRANTVDRFQGMERPIVLVSLVRSKQGNMGEFVRQFQRINVGFSRAQELLVVIGAAETFKRASIELPPLEGGPLSSVAVYRNIFDLAVRSGGRRYAWQLLP